MLTTFDRYLIGRYLYAFAVLFITTLGLYVVIDGFTNVDAFQMGQDSAADVLRWMAQYYGFQSIQFFSLTAPILSVLAMMIVFALLHKNSELQPVLAAGIPVYRLALPVLLGTAIVGVVTLVNQEVIIPRISHHLQGAREQEKTTARPVEPLYDNSQIHIRGRNLNLEERRLEDAEFILPTTPKLVREMTPLKAAEAIHFPATADREAGWLLRDAQPSYEQLPLTEDGKKVVRRTNRPKDVFVMSSVTIDQLTNRSKNYRYLSTPQLVERIRNPTTGFLSLRGQTLYFHNRIVRPLVGMLSVFIVVPLVLRRESRSLVANMALCGVVVGLLYGCGELFQYLSHARLIPPDLAAWTPAILTSALAAWLSELAQT